MYIFFVAVVVVYSINHTFNVNIEILKPYEMPLVAIRSIRNVVANFKIKYLNT